MPAAWVGETGRPNLALSNVTTGTIVSNQNGSFTIPVTYTVTNNGTTAAQPTWYDLAYLSVDGVLDNADQTMTGYNRASYTVMINYTSAANTANGNYTVFLKADGRNYSYVVDGTNTDAGKVIESDDTNNTVALPTKLGSGF